MRTKRFIYTLFLLLLTCAVKSQNDSRLFESAQEAYEFGLFERADSLLRDSVDIFKGETKIGVFRLLALSNLNMDKPEVAETWVSRLLAVDPYYRVYNDVPRFTEMVEKMKKGKTATITTASSHEESLNEAPVPVTLITEQMIIDCGADNLRDVLAAYVPGMTVIEGTGEYNISMHGIYSSRQEKILIMLNGHRLNARSTNAFAPDYGMSLEKIKQIEVLRGPASSLYGNVALTAVVNIITKDGGNINGVDITAKYGSFSTYHTNAMLGYIRAGFDITTWASIYSSQGERIDYPTDATGVWRIIPSDAHTYINGFNNIPSYDVGLNLKWNDHWKLYSNLRYSKMQSSFTFTASGMSSPYDYEKYRVLDGQKPGRGRRVWNNELEYKASFGKWDIDISGYFDLDEYRDYDVVADSLPFVLRLPLPAVELLDTIELQNGVYQRPKWNDYTYGVNMNTNRNYKTGVLGSGNLLLGLQYENYHLYNTDVVMGDRFDRILIDHAEAAEKIVYGYETSLSGYAQIKHNFSKSWILNAGMRYDYKYRFDKSEETAFSPRICLIFAPNLWSFKLSYSRSFVDAPYLNRASTIESYKGGAHLKPEFMDAVQFCGIIYSPKLHLNYDFTAYYNALSDLVYYDKSAPLSGLPAYMNAGSVKLVGLENSIAYNNMGLRVNLNFSYLRVLEADKYHTTGEYVNLTPSFTLNAVGAKRIFADNRNTKSLWANAKLSYWTKQLMKASSYRDGVVFSDPEYEISPATVTDVSLIYQTKRFDVQLQCKNLFNTSYTRPTTYNINIPQLSRSIFVELKVHL